MSAVVRVKRRIDEEPLSGFVLNCKKRKVNGNENRPENLFETKDEISTVLKFAGTVESQTEHVVEQINRLTKDEAKSLVKKVRKPNNLTEKNRQEMRDNLHENRFKIVNCYRTINDEETKAITIVDIEKQNDEMKSNDEITSIKNTNESHMLPSTSNSNNISSTSSNNTNITTDSINENFVYDLYLPENEEQIENANHMDDYTINNISVRPFDDLVYDERYKEEDSDDGANYDSDDSNCEGYYKNDYPDDYDDGNNSVCEFDMRRAVEEIDLDDDRALSSDDESNFNNGFVYSVDAEGIGFEDDIDYCTVNRYGEAYARYKRRITKENKQTDLNDKYDSNVDDDFDSE